LLPTLSSCLTPDEDDDEDKYLIFDSHIPVLGLIDHDGWRYEHGSSAPLASASIIKEDDAVTESKAVKIVKIIFNLQPLLECL
jgi:hypothetical protein